MKRKEKQQNAVQKQTVQNGFAVSMAKSMFLKLRESLVSVLPIVILVLVLALTPLVEFSMTEFVTFLVSALCLVIGIGLFNLGADIAMTPMGEFVGRGLTKSRNLKVLIIVCFVMGILITVAEPDLSVLAGQVPMNNILLISIVGVGVALFLVVAIVKIVFKKDLSALLIFFSMIMFALAAILLETGKSNFLPLAFDSGGVTTGPITVPFIMALGVGIALTIGGKNANENSFGLIALCSIGPIIAVIILSLASKGEVSYELPDYSIAANLGANFGLAIGHIVLEVTIALGLIVAFFFVLQFTVLKSRLLTLP